MNEVYGRTQSEEDLEKILQCRDIVKEIINFGVSQKQLLLIIQFLAAEIEDHEQMAVLTATVRDIIKGDKILLIDKAEDSNGSASS